MPYWLDFGVPNHILEDAYDSFGDPTQTSRDLKCAEDEHTKVRAYVECKDGRRNATFVCEDCGENLVASNGNWVSQEDWDESDWEVAQDWDKIREDFDDRVESLKKERKTRIREYCKARVQSYREQIPSKDASGQDWHDYLSELVPGSNDWDWAYDRYLESNWWESRKKRVLNAKKAICRLQYPGCTKRATHVHHESYHMIGFEPLTHLVPACKSCHEKLHRVRDDKVIA